MYIIINPLIMLVPCFLYNIDNNVDKYYISDILYERTRF